MSNFTERQPVLARKVSHTVCSYWCRSTWLHTLCALADYLLRSRPRSGNTAAYAGLVWWDCPRYSNRSGANSRSVKLPTSKVCVGLRLLNGGSQLEPRCSCRYKASGLSVPLLALTHRTSFLVPTTTLLCSNFLIDRSVHSFITVVTQHSLFQNEVHLCRRSGSGHRCRRCSSKMRYPVPGRHAHASVEPDDDESDILHR